MHLEPTSKHKNFIFLYELGFSVVSRPRRGKLKQGTSAYVTVFTAKSRNISVIAARNKYGMIFHKIYDKAVTGEDFKHCLIELKGATVFVGVKNLIYSSIFDDARIHHYCGLQETINQLSLNICYLPLYSSFLNYYRKHFFCIEKISHPRRSPL